MKFIRTLSLLLLSVHSLNAQVSVLAKVDHLVPDGVDTIGNINLTVSGSTAPYTYTWNPVAVNTKDINNIVAGSYSLNVLSASAQTYTNVYSVGYKALWTNLSNAYYRNDSLVSTQPASNLFGTACSKNTLLPNTDGWFEYVFDNLNGLNYYVCFTDSLSPISNRAYDLDYGIYFSGGSSDNINYWENGATGYLATPKIGDVVKVERVGDVIKYLVNNVLKRSTTVSGISQKQLKLKANLQYNTNRLVNVGCSFANTDNISFINYVLATPLIKHNSGAGINDGSISITPKIAGTYSYTWQPGGVNTSSITPLSNGIYTLTIKDDLNNQSTYKYNIGYKAQWTNLDRATFRNDSLFSNSSSTAINAISASKNTLAANTDGWFEYVVSSSLSNYYTIGFTDSISPNTGAYDIDYGIYYAGNTGYINSYQNGTTVSLQLVNIGDIVRVERIGNTVNYKINGVLLRTVTVSGISQKNWKLKASLLATRVINVGCSFNKQDSTTFQNYVKVIPTVKHNTGPGINDGSISLKLKNGISSSYTWTPGSVNSNSITSLANGIYSVSAQDSLSNKSNYTYEIGNKVQWTSLNRCYVNGDTLRSTSGINYIYSNAVSKNTLLPNTDGWFEYLFQPNYYYYIGFSDSISPGPSFSDIDYGIYFFQQVGSLQYYENGTQANIYVTPNLGDRIRIERVGNTMYYKINGITVRSVTNSSISQKTFKIKANLAGVTGNTNRLVDVGCSFTKRDTIAFSNYVEVMPVIRHASNVASNDGSIKITPRLSGTHSYTWQASDVTTNSVTALSSSTYSTIVADAESNKSTYNYNVGYKTLWKDFNQYCFSRNDSLISTGPTTNNFGYACSKNELNANTDGWFEYVIQDAMSAFYLGFIDNTANNPLVANDINYGFYYRYNNGYWWFSYIESGTTGYFYLPYRKGDVLRIERIGNTINYKINGILLRTVTNTNIGPKVFKLKAISYYQNKLVNVGCSFTPCTYTASAGATQTITCTSPSATLTGSTNSPSGSTYSWTPGGSTPTSSVTVVSSAGIYTLSVTDPVYGCVATSTVAVSGALSFNSSITNYKDDVNKGQINLCIIGGTPPYNIAWNGMKMLSNHDYYIDLSNNISGLSIDTTKLYPQLDSLRQITSFSNLSPGIYTNEIYDSVNDSASFISMIGNEVSWITSGVNTNTCVIPKSTINGEVVFYGNGEELTQSGGSGLGYVVLGGTFNSSESSSYIGFKVPNEADVIAAGFKLASNTNSQNVEDMFPNTFISFLGDRTMKIYFNSSVVYTGTNNSGDEFGILFDSGNKNIEYYQNGSKIHTQAEGSTNIFSKNLQFKGSFSSVNAKLKDFVIVGTQYKKWFFSGTPTDVTCATSTSGQINFSAYSLFSFDLICNYTLTGPNGYSNTGNVLPGNNAILGLSPGVYNLSIPVYNLANGCGSTPSTYLAGTYTIAYMPDWVNLYPSTGTNVSPIDKSFSINVNQASPYTWACGASSENGLAQIDDGWAEFQPLINPSPVGSFNIIQPSSAMVFGLSDIDANTTPANIDHSFYVKPAGITQSIPIGGIPVITGPYITTIKSQSTILGVPFYTWPADVLKIKKIALSSGANMKFEFYKNNVLLNTSPSYTGLDLIADISVNQTYVIIKKPRISFGCKFSYQYGIVKPKLDGGYYNAYGGKLYFKYDEEYQDSDVKLNFNIYNSQNAIVYSSTSPALPLSSLPGDNRYYLDFSAATPLTSGFYVLEVINEKNEKWYLRFKK